MERLSIASSQDAGELIKEFSEDSILRGMTPETTRRYRSSLGIFMAFLRQENVEVNGIDMETLGRFLGYLRFERKLKHKTLENDFSGISSFYDYLVFQGIVSSNIVLPFRKRYLRRYKGGTGSPQRKLLTLGEMSKLVNSILDPRDRAIAVVLAKTGIRRGELLRIDTIDIDWENYSLLLKLAPKRTNRRVFFDDETALVLRRWMKVREKLKPRTQALFVSYESFERLNRNGVYSAITKHAKRLGFHNPCSERIEDHFSPHCFRHFFTTALLRGGMRREYVKFLRGDSRREAIDLYDHIDEEDVRKAYLASVPKLGV